MILKNTMPSEALVRVVKFHQKNQKEEIGFDTRPAQVTDVARSWSSLGTDEDPVQPHWESAWGNPMRPYMETALGNPSCDNSDNAQISCIDPRVQRKPDQLADDEEQKKRSLTQSLTMEVLPSPDKDKVMAQFSKETTTRSTKIFLRISRML